MHSSTAVAPACDASAFFFLLPREPWVMRDVLNKTLGLWHTKYLLSHPPSTICFCWLTYTLFTFLHTHHFLSFILLHKLFSTYLYLMHTFTFSTPPLWCPSPCRNRRDFVYWSGARWCDGHPQQRDHHAMWCCAGQRHLHRQWKHAHRLELKSDRILDVSAD